MSSAPRAGYLFLAPLLLMIAAEPTFAQQLPQPRRSRPRSKPPSALAYARETVRRFNVDYQEVEDLAREGIPILDAEISTSAAVSARTKDCVKTFTVDGMINSYQSAWHLADIGTDTSSFFSHLADAKAAEALEKGNRALCGGGALLTSAPRYPSNMNVVGSCRSIYANLAWSRAVILKSPGLPRICREEMAGIISADLLDKGCDILVRYSDRPGVATAKLSAFEPGLRSHARRAENVIHEASVAGSIPESECSKAGGGAQVEMCVASVRFKKAHESGDPSLCGASGLCLAMMKRPGAAQPYAKELAQQFCGRFARNPDLAIAPSQARQAYMAKMKEMRGLVDAAMKAIADDEPKSDPHYSEVREEVLEMRTRLSDLEHPPPDGASTRRQSESSSSKEKGRQ